MGEQFSRGRIEVTIRVDDGEDMELEGRLALNTPKVRYYYDLLTQLKQELALSDEITLAMMSSFRDIFIPKENESAPDVAWGDLETVLQATMATLMDMRQIEGEALKKDLMARIAVIKENLEGVSLRAPVVVVEYRKRLTDRIKELTNGMVVDEARLIQEVAIMAEKSDITEEIVRMESHMAQFIDLLTSGDCIGRKVDFLIQEMNREVNTIGSKSGDAEIARQVIEMKSEMAKLREQVQNIE